jgi:mutator protein MutT
VNSASAPVLVAAAVIVRGGSVLLSQRSEGTHLAGAWEFPGGKIEPGESPAEAVGREIREELGIGLEGIEPFRFAYHQYADARVLLLTFLCRPVGDPDRASIRWKWVPFEELDPASMPEADRAIVESLKTGRYR